MKTTSSDHSWIVTFVFIGALVLGGGSIADGGTDSGGFLWLQGPAGEEIILLYVGQTTEIQIALELGTGFIGPVATATVFLNNRVVAGSYEGLLVTDVIAGQAEPPFTYDRSGFELPTYLDDSSEIDDAQDEFEGYRLLMTDETIGGGIDNPTDGPELLDRIMILTQEPGEYHVTFQQSYNEMLMPELIGPPPDYTYYLNCSFIDIAGCSLVFHYDLGTGNPTLYGEPLILRVAACAGDVNRDAVVDSLDLGFTVARLGCAVGTGDPECDRADANADGAVDPLDVGYSLARFGPCDLDDFPMGPLSPPPIERVSIGLDGSESDYSSSGSDLSGDGRIITFHTKASTLVENDTNESDDIFVRDRDTEITRRISMAYDGSQTDANSRDASISDDGCVVAFQSDATNLVEGDTNDETDIFVFDCQTDGIERVSVGPGGAQGDGRSSAPWLSGDGRWVAFDSDASNLIDSDTNDDTDIFVFDRQLLTMTRVSISTDGDQADGYSVDPSISDDGRFVAFRSSADNLVDDDSNGLPDIFVHDLETGHTERVNIHTNGTEAESYSFYPAISGDGRYVGFQSWSDNLVDGDTNGQTDIFVHDRQTGTTERVSLRSDGVESNGYSSHAALSNDGRWVTFHSQADNLVEGVANIFQGAFVHDRNDSTTAIIGVGMDGYPGDGGSYLPVVSGDGYSVSFYSWASDLIDDDTNAVADVFVVELPQAADSMNGMD